MKPVPEPGAAGSAEPTMADERGVAPPFGRLVRAEVTWVLRRPRTVVVFALFALYPVLIASGVVPPGRGGGRGLVGAVADNGLALPVAAITAALPLLLPLAVGVAAADAISGEAAQGTLRGLVLAPVGRLRLVAMKAIGVLVVACGAVTTVAVSGMLAGLVLVGTVDGRLLTLSGTTVDLVDALGRVGLVSGWALIQLVGVGALALAVSALSDTPLIVLAGVLGGLVASGLLASFPAFDRLTPYLLTSGWYAGADVLRDPLPLGGLIDTSLTAVIHLVVGGVVLVTRMVRRDA